MTTETNLTEEAAPQDQPAQKSATTKLDWGQVNIQLSIVLKLLAIAGIGFAIYVGVSSYTNYAHFGPTCSANDFTYWINKKTLGKVVSVHQSRLQAENGTTSCFGTFQTKDGSYKDWSGSVTELNDGTIIGHASIQ